MKNEIKSTDFKIPEQLPPASPKEVEYNQIQRLLGIGKSALTELDVDHVLTTAVDLFIQISGAERGIVVLFNETGKNHYTIARNAGTKDIQVIHGEIIQMIITKVTEEGKPIFTKNFLDDLLPNQNKIITSLKPIAVICIPLNFSGECFGVLYLDNFAEPDLFRCERFQLIKDFAEFICLAIYQERKKKDEVYCISSVEETLRSNYDFEAIVGHSPKMIEVLQVISQVADTDVPVLIEGETGTGKEIVARAIHSNSKRGENPLVCVNCGAFPENMLESEFFGHEKGAFTGAYKRHKGKFEQADGGTIFLDEIDDMSPALQVKLLRVLQWGEFSPVGSEGSEKCNVRIVAASKQRLQRLVNKGTFRDDLYYRLNLIRLQLPPLRERREDILPLANHLLQNSCKRLHKPNLTLSQEVQEIIKNYHYPGNVRELENIIRHAAILCRSDLIRIQHLPPEIRKIYSIELQSEETVTSMSFKEAKNQAIENFERRYLERILKESDGVIRKAARRAGMHEKNFHEKLKKYGIRSKNSNQ